MWARSLPFQRRHGADPTDPQSWTKHDRPVFQPTRDVFGVGHCCFTRSPDGAQDWIVYHAKRHRRDGWDRDVRAQPFAWRPDGLPDFGRPVPAGEELALPTGDSPGAAEGFTMEPVAAEGSIDTSQESEAA